MNKIKTSLIALMLALQAFIPLAGADFLPVRAYGKDTVAGYASKLTTSLVNPNQNVVFVVEKPDGAVVRVPATADLEGSVSAEFYGHQTKQAGSYKVAVLFPGSVDSSPQSRFTVFPDQVSVSQSDLKSTEQMVTADGKEKTFLTLSLYDAYRNPIPEHRIQLISSRPEDEIEALNGGVTDERGQANFKALSKFPGISVFTALDATQNLVLSDREEVVFIAPVAAREGIGGNLLSVNLLGADIGQADSAVLPGPVDHFDIEDLPSQVTVNSEQTLTVVARDKNNNVAKNYTGTILIAAPDDENAVLPSNGEYTFRENDQGKFTFNLALQFTQLGKQTLQIFDKNNWKITGEREIEVVSEKTIVTPAVSKTLSVKSPVDGAELGSSLVIVSGQGDSNINLKIFDNDAKIGDSETDGDGFFSFQAQNLQSGAHTFYVMSESGEVSAPVTVQIDTLPPVLNSFFIDPEGAVAPGTPLTITLQSEPNLEEVKVRLQGVEEPIPALSVQPGTYEGTVAAPVTEGTFPIDVILVDKLANKAELLNKATVQIKPARASRPPKVEGFEAAPGDASVELSWKEITDTENPVAKYRIYYGTVFDSLDASMDTPDAVSSYQLSGLANGQQYFFAVRAVDSKGMESEEPSVTLAVTPVAATPAEPLVPGSTEVTPGETTLPVSHAAAGEIQGTSSPNAVTLRWEPFPNINAYAYKVYFGIRPGAYDDYIITEGSRPSLEIRDLINGLPYYFAVAALDASGLEISPLSAEFTLTPGGSGFTTVPGGSISRPSYAPPLGVQLGRVPGTEETGPEALWIVILSLILAHLVSHYKRRFFHSS